MELLRAQKSLENLLICHQSMVTTASRCNIRERPSSSALCRMSKCFLSLRSPYIGSSPRSSLPSIPLCVPLTVSPYVPNMLGRSSQPSMCSSNREMGQYGLPTHSQPTPVPSTQTPLSKTSHIITACTQALPKRHLPASSPLHHVTMYANDRINSTHVPTIATKSHRKLSTLGTSGVNQQKPSKTMNNLYTLGTSIMNQL